MPGSLLESGKEGEFSRLCRNCRLVINYKRLRGEYTAVETFTDIAGRRTTCPVPSCDYQNGMIGVHGHLHRCSDGSHQLMGKIAGNAFYPSCLMPGEKASNRRHVYQGVSTASSSRSSTVLGNRQAVVTGTSTSYRTTRGSRSVRTPNIRIAESEKVSDRPD